MSKLVTDNTGKICGIDIKNSYSVPTSMNFNGISGSTGPTGTGGDPGYMPIHINDNTRVSFDDGNSYTGKEMAAFMRVMKKLVEEDYPEELL